MSGRQCLKKLYLGKYHRDLKTPVSPSLQARFDAGHEVGQLAQLLFPGGVDCTPEHYYDFGPSLEKTLENIHYGQPVIYEAAFQYDGVLAALDILVLKEDGWYGYEVKATNETKPQHIEDAALQFWVMKHAAHRPHKMHIVHLNRDYVRDGELDIQQLFVIDDVTEAVLKMQKEVNETVNTQKALLESKLLPDIDIGPYCKKPYECDFKSHCWQHIPKYSVFNLANATKKKWQLYHQGILQIADIPEDFKLTEKQSIQVNSEKTGQTHIDQAGIREFLDGLQYPLYYLDFESIQPTVPIYNQSRPYQQICFQYSLHIQQEAGQPIDAIEHREFLAEADDADPRRSLLEQLIPDLGDAGDILVYNLKFEAGRLKEMARDFPEYAEAIEPLLDRLKDLMDPFMHKLYYSPEMHGSYSMKKVLPALVPEMGYEGLEIGEGMEAMLVFLEMVSGRFEGDLEGTRTALLEYCKMDTLGMVGVLGVIERSLS